MWRCTGALSVHAPNKGYVYSQNLHLVLSVDKDMSYSALHRVPLSDVAKKLLGYTILVRIFRTTIWMFLRLFGGFWYATKRDRGRMLNWIL